MNGIVLAIIAVSAIGLISAVVLSVASKVMAVPVDERFGPVRECLPGANCGACGYAGCDAYAQALISGECTSATLCVPGGADAAKGIGTVLGLAVGDVKPMVAAVKCNGTCGNTSDKLEYASAKTCKGAKLFFGGKGSCTYGCMGLGDCADVCPVHAIDMVDGIAHIDTDLCIGCGLCAKTCPNNVIEIIPFDYKIHVNCNSKDKGAVVMKNCKVGCIGCMKCQKACQFDAITVVDNLAHIDQEKCTACGACVEQCPKQCIHITKK
ncbi:MAG: RnfABCDGE type electron transport complex subunit B [Candidatus Fimivivens sp.]|nr:RnfABCDGE type electron transport complex subunit B [Candidatus Fimivivens sp.]